MAEERRPKVFISYSWTSDVYQREVVALAERLFRDGVEVVLDVWDLHPGDDAHAFMERCVTDPSVDKVLILCNEAYAERADAREGGVGIETTVITPALYGRAQQDRFVPVLMERGANKEEYLPAYLRSRIYIDLSDAAHEKQYEDLLRHIYGVPRWPKPKPGGRPSWLQTAATAPGVSSAGAGKAVAGSNSAAGVAPKAFADYSWAELEAIADQIAAAGSDGEGLRIAGPTCWWIGTSGSRERPEM